MSESRRSQVAHRHRKPVAVLTVLANGQPMAIGASGHYRADADVSDEMVYVVQTTVGQETLTPAEFAAKYGWRNDPAQAHFGEP